MRDLPLFFAGESAYVAAMGATVIDREVGPQTTRVTAATPPMTTAGTRSPSPRQSLLLGALVAAVVVADQATKWWAWRRCAAVTINPGGDLLVGGALGSCFRSSIGGAVLDVADSAVLGAVTVALLRRRRPLPVSLSASVFLAGWISNLSDRLGLHYWTAPGSVRGAVDFLRLGGSTVYNGADIAIVVGAMGSVASLCWYRGGHAGDPATDATTPPDPRRAAPGRAGWLLAGIVVVTVLAGYGVTHSGYAYVPARMWSVAGST